MEHTYPQRKKRYNRVWKGRILFMSIIHRIYYYYYFFK
jgi:hypothetical protein